MTNRQKRAAELAQGMELCVNEYLAKAAEDESQDVKAMALCVLGRRVAPCCGTCFCLDFEED